MAHKKIAVGMRFGRLTVVGDGPYYLSPGGASLKRWHCVCDCGGETDVTGQKLNSGHTASCGCLKQEYMDGFGDLWRKYGESDGVDSAEYSIWTGMQDRCRNPNNAYYARYGGRGITVCDRWTGENGYTNFLADMGRRPTEKHSIDRIGLDGNYEPGNCRWATPPEQARNTSRNIWIEYGGERLCVKDWAKRTGLSADGIRTRLLRGWSGAQAIGMEPHPRAFKTGPIPR